MTRSRAGRGYLPTDKASLSYLLLCIACRRRSGMFGRTNGGVFNGGDMMSPVSRRLAHGNYFPIFAKETHLDRAWSFAITSGIFVQLGADHSLFRFVRRIVGAVFALLIQGHIGGINRRRVRIS